MFNRSLYIAGLQLLLKLAPSQMFNRDICGNLFFLFLQCRTLEEVKLIAEPSWPILACREVHAGSHILLRTEI